MSLSPEAEAPVLLFNGAPLETAKDVADFFGVGYGQLIYILYRAPEKQRYIPFEIPKRTGGMRQILAPVGLIRDMQEKLAPLLAERVFVAGLALAAGALALSRGRWHGPASASTLALLALSCSTWALLVSRTRSAWLGLAMGALTIAVLRAPRTAILVPLGIAGVLVLRPAPVIERLTVTGDADPAAGI